MTNHSLLGASLGRSKRLAKRLLFPRVVRAEATRAWSIGIYVGPSPVALRSPRKAMWGGIRNPVLTPADVTDVRAATVADPFMIRRAGIWYMFFEVVNEAASRGEIGMAVSRDGFAWTYQGIVLAEPFHLSYPYVFEYGGTTYMIPESFQAEAVRLYEATDFPKGWTLARTLLRGGYFADTSVFNHDGMWWMFTETNPELKHDCLRLLYARDLTGPWQEHPRSPIIDGDPHVARPAGRVLSMDGRLIRYAQDDYPHYGRQVRAFEITELTPARYAERLVTRSPMLRPAGLGWNSAGMHHVDPHPIGAGRWIACVDGFGVTRMPR